MLVALEVPRIPRMFVRALKISHEDLTQVRPVVNPIFRGVLEPSSSRVDETKIIPLCPTSPTDQEVVIKSEAGVHFPGVLGDVGGRAVP